MHPGVQEHASGTVLRVRVQPRASREAITATPDAIRVALTAPPVDGEANAALLKFLAGQLKLPKSSLQLISGDKSRDKAVLIPGRTPEQVCAQLKLDPHA